jgi:hypothetical protein
VGFDERSLRFTGQQPQSYESSQDVWRSFCRVCGSPVSYRAKRFPGEVHVYVGVLDDPARYEPTAHVYFAEHLPWFDTADHHRRYQQTSAG